MSALTNRILHLRRQGVSSPQEIANIVGLTATEVAARLKDPSLADPTEATGVIGGGSGGGGAVKVAHLILPNYGKLGDPAGDDPAYPFIEDGQTWHFDDLEEWNAYAPTGNQMSGLVQDDIGLIFPAPVLSDDRYFGLPQGIFLIHATIFGVSGGFGIQAPWWNPGDPGYGGADNHKFYSLTQVIEGNGGKSLNSGSGSMSTGNAVLNQDAGSDFAGLTTTHVLDATLDMATIDPGYEGLWGWVRVRPPRMDRLDGTANYNGTRMDAHEAGPTHVTILQLA